MKAIEYRINRRKRLWGVAMCLLTVLFSACGQGETGDPGAAGVSPLEEIAVSIPPETNYSETTFMSEESASEPYVEPGTDPYEGEYNDYDANEPSLEILKNEDGTYTIQIGIFRLAYLDDGVGTVTEDGISFSATGPDGNPIYGTITLEGEVATVAFDSAQWEAYSSINEYQYYKTSDVPDIHAN